MKKERLILTLLLFVASSTAKNLYEAIMSTPNFSQVAKIINSSKILPVMLQAREFTAFMPTDEAMNKYTGVKDEKLLHYHLANIAYKIQDVPDEISTELTGNPVLYVTKIASGKPSITGWENFEYFINNAKVTSANHRSEGDGGVIQYLHTLDTVITPTVAQVSGPEAHLYRFPDARKVLEKSNVYGFVDKLDLRVLKARVEELNLLDEFATSGKNTFFMPVTQALTLILRTDKILIDKQVIHGHIVPEKVLFTRTVRDSKEQFKSLAFEDNLKVLISIENVTNSDTKEMTYYVKSNTVAGDPSHMKGAALARIVKGNIPVSNGVIHLIDRPLMVVASSIMSYLQEDKGQLTEFHKLMSKHYPDMTNLLVSKKDITLFAPSNKAFEMVNQDRLDRVLLNKEKLGKIMRLHIVNRRITTDEIVERSTKEIFQEDTMSGGRKLYFTVKDPEAYVPIVSLEGGGVNATISTPNIAAKNGVIHIIDRILGIPSQTVYEKLASDPMLRSTFELSQQKGWNEPLKDRSKKFTLFVPSDQAWDFIRREMPSAYKKLFMGEYSSHVKSILQRHMIANQELDLEELENLTTNTTQVRENIRQTPLQMTRGKIYFQARVKENFGEYYVEWNGVAAKVIRPDVECVNGVVHVINKVLMLKSDVTVSGSISSYTTNKWSAFVATIISITLAWSLV